MLSMSSASQTADPGQTMEPGANGMGAARQRSQGLLRQDSQGSMTNGTPEATEHIGITVPRTPPREVTPKSTRSWFLQPHIILDFVAVVVLLIIYAAVNVADARVGYMIFDTMYKHSYPYKENSVPSWTVPVYSIGAPLVAFLAWKLISWRRQVTWYDFYRCFMAMLFAVFLTGAITNCLKIAVGRPRPNFYFQCFPNGTAVYESANQYGGYPVCTDPAHVQEFRKSFPSGHASFSASGLGFLTYWMMGQLRTCVGGKARAWAFFLSLVPALGALIVGVSRITDYWHNVSDVCVGLGLGFFIAFVTYLMLFPFFINPLCYCPRYAVYEEQVRLEEKRSGPAP